METWITAVLANDEFSTDEELVRYFLLNGLSERDAQKWVARRSDYLTNIRVKGAGK